MASMISSEIPVKYRLQSFADMSGTGESILEKNYKINHRKIELTNYYLVGRILKTSSLSW
jgi:hypothetical protein